MRLGAVETDHVGELLNRIEELVEVHGTSQRDVSKVSRAELVRLFAGGAHLAILNDAETGIEYTIGNGLVALIGLVSSDLDDGALANIFGIRNPKLDSNDSVTHVIASYLL